MKKIILLVFCMASAVLAYCQKPTVKIAFINDYPDVFHLSLIIYTPDGKNQVRVSNVEPGKQKLYEYPAGTVIYIANWQQEASAMKGNDIKASGAKPDIILQESAKNLTVKLSAISVRRNLPKEALL